MRYQILMILIPAIFCIAAHAHGPETNLKTDISAKYESIQDKTVAQMTDEERGLHYAVMQIEPATDLANIKYKSNFFSSKHTDFNVYIDSKTYEVFVETALELCKLELEQVVGFNHMAPHEQDEWVLTCKDKT